MNLQHSFDLFTSYSVSLFSDKIFFLQRFLVTWLYISKSWILHVYVYEHIAGFILIFLPNNRGMWHYLEIMVKFVYFYVIMCF